MSDTKPFPPTMGWDDWSLLCTAMRLDPNTADVSEVLQRAAGVVMVYEAMQASVFTPHNPIAWKNVKSAIETIRRDMGGHSGLGAFEDHLKSASIDALSAFYRVIRWYTQEVSRLRYEVTTVKRRNQFW